MTEAGSSGRLLSAGHTYEFSLEMHFPDTPLNDQLGTPPPLKHKVTRCE